jgi:hypothetical protein
MTIPNESPGHNGRSLDHKAWRRAVRTPAGRALLAHELSNGGVYVHGLVQRQAAKVAGCFRSQLQAVDAASAAERDALARGWITLGSLARKQPVSDAAVQACVSRVGATLSSKSSAPRPRSRFSKP